MAATASLEKMLENNKIGDMLLLGIFSGFAGNIPKVLICDYLAKKGVIEISCPERSGKILVRTNEIKTPAGKFVGYMTDGLMSGLLGVIYTYGLAATGNNKAVLKGALAGPPSWILLSALSTFMGDEDSQLSPRTVLYKFMLSAIHGAAACYIATRAGRLELFEGSNSSKTFRKKGGRLQIPGIIK